MVPCRIVSVQHDCSSLWKLITRTQRNTQPKKNFAHLNYLFWWQKPSFIMENSYSPGAALSYLVPSRETSFLIYLQCLYIIPITTFPGCLAINQHKKQFKYKIEHKNHRIKSNIKHDNSIHRVRTN